MNPHQKYLRAKEKIEEILRDYSYESLKDGRNNYIRTRDQNYKNFNDTYRRYNRNMNIIQNYESNEARCTCGNCKRRELPLTFCSYNNIKNNKHFKHIPRRNNNHVALCHECHTYLTTQELEEPKDFMWPSYIWYLLSDDEIHSKYGSYIWRFIPMEWRVWWLESCRTYHRHVFENITLQQPSPFFVDRTDQLEDFNTLRRKYELPSLKKICNNYMMPTVKCPWGCTEMMHRSGILPLDVIYQRYLPKVTIKTMTSTTERLDRNVVSAREDFLMGNGFEDSWYFNPKWEVMPSISFVRGKGPCLMTCQPHHGGTKKYMVHQCRWKHNLAAKEPDQLCQAVVNPRQIKPVKASSYSNSYQMYQQTGSFSGIDTCTQTSYGRFDFVSKLSREAEARSIANRPDINAHLNSLVDDEIMSDFLAEDKRKHAVEFSQEVNYEHYTYGSTYVPLEAAMVMQRENSDRSVEVIVNGDGDTVTINKYWSSTLYPCQQMTSHGIAFPTIPKLQSSSVKTKNVWILGSLLSRVERLWKCTEKCPLDTSKWHGWMLSYLTEHCFNQAYRKRQNNDPFKGREIETVAKFIEKIGVRDLNQYIHEIPKVHYHDVSLSPQINLPVDNDKTEVIIVNNFNPQQYQIANTLIVNNIVFHLQTIVGTKDIDDGVPWEGDIYSKHEGEKFYSWWYNKSTQQIPIKVDTPPETLPLDQVYTLAYVCKESNSVNDLRNEFMKSIGGQTHVQCEVHKVPLIPSTEKTRNCSCGKRESMRCCHLFCNVQLCKPCYKEADKEEITYIPPVIENYGTGIENRTGESDDDSLLSENSLSEQHLIHDDFDNFISHSLENDYIDYVVDNLLDPGGGDELNELNVIPTTNAGIEALEIDHTTEYAGTHGKYTIDGHVLLNQCGTLLSRKRHQIKGNKRHQHMLQKINATCSGKSVPLMYPESLLFPSIHYKVANDSSSVCGCIPAPMLTDSTSNTRFEPLDVHIRSRLTNASSATSTDPRYICHCYDVLTNQTANHEDTRLILNRGLTVDENNDFNLTVRGKNDSSLLPSTDSKQIVRNLCTSQKYHNWSFFLTFTCNMKTHFGTAPIKEWIDSGEWKQHFPGFYELEKDEQNEIEDALKASAASIFLRVWEETYLLFVEYLQKSKSSPFKDQKSIFSRKEYQKDRGNLSHAHVMNEVDWENLTDDQIDFVEDLIRASVCDIVRSDEVSEYIEEGIFDSVDDYYVIKIDGETFLAHRCNDSCLVRMPDGTLRCQKLNNVNISDDNTKHCFEPLPNNYSIECLQILEKVGLTDELEIDDDGNVLKFESNLPFFHPTRHVPPTNPNDDKNISPVIGKLFASCKSMQNAQRIKGSGGCSKYICKYIAKIDEQNYVVVEVDGRSQLITKAHYLHNTKISSSKTGEEKQKVTNKNHNKIQGRVISLLEMLHIMLKYPEVVTDVEFCQVPTVPLELRPRIKISTDKGTDENGNVVRRSGIDEFRSDTFPERHWRNHTEHQRMIINDVKLSGVSVDKVTQFSLRPPELLKIFDHLEGYYRWFHISPKKVATSDLDKVISDSFESSSWIDGLQRQVRVRKKALKEVKKWMDEIVVIDNIDLQDETDPRCQVIHIFEKIIAMDEGSIEVEQEFQSYTKEHLIYEDDREVNLPVPVYSYINPNMGTHFLYHIMLSLGRFETELDITTQQSMRDSLRYCKLIGDSIDEDSLYKDAYRLTKKYIVEQLQYFPNTQRVLDAWIIAAYHYFISIIVKDEVPMSEMPPVLMSDLHKATEEEVTNFITELKEELIEAATAEVGNTEAYELPSKEALLATTKSNTIEWDAVNKLHMNENQSQESFDAQKFAIETCIETLDKYTNFARQTTYTKNIGIRGFPGAGKTWCMMYTVLYAISKGLKCTTSAMMCNRALQLGGIHAHKLFMLPPEQQQLTAHRRAELAIATLLKTPKKLHLLQTIDVIFWDEMGQVSAEMLNTFDIILKEIRKSNIYMGGVLFIFSMDHTQIQPVNGRPFLTSCNIISCYKMVALEHSVRASTDSNFKRIQQIARYSHRKLKEEPHLIEEFIHLCSTYLQFAPNWDSDLIKPDTMRLYSKRIPSREAAKTFVNRVKRQIDPSCLKERKADDVQKSRFSHRDWSDATERTIESLEQRLKEPKELLFFKHAVYEITFNKENEFSHGQIAILLDLPTDDQLNNWKKINVLVAPPGIKDFVFSEYHTKEDFLANGFKEKQIGIAPERTQYLANNVQAQRKQYGLKHRVTSTIHAAMGDTLKTMATEISLLNKDYKMWDKGQLVVILSRTKRASDSIFVGDKNDTLNALKHLLLSKTQWTDHIEEVLELATINSENNNREQRILTQDEFPYRICDFSLPQCNTGFVYMIVSLRDKQTVYIRKTLSL